MKLVLGIDAGGTQTRAALATATGRVVGTGHAGPGNPYNVGETAALRNMAKATHAAWAAAGIELQPAQYAYIGAAGLKTRADFVRLQSLAEKEGVAAAGSIEVANDLHNALAGGLAGNPGIALIAGTGSNCLGRDPSGTTFMCGGWSWLMGDEGAGFGLAIAGLRKAVRAADGRSIPTRLLESALAYFGITEPNGLLAALHTGGVQPDRIAAFAPTVCRLADEGDPQAVAVLEEGAAELADLVATTQRNLNFEGETKVVLLGGTLQQGSAYSQMVTAAIHHTCATANIVPAKHSPLYGAALNALRMQDPTFSQTLTDPSHRLSAPEQSNPKY